MTRGPAATPPEKDAVERDGCDRADFDEKWIRPALWI